MKKGYLSKHATEILKHYQDEGRLDVIDITTQKPARKGAYYLNYEAAKNPKVRFKLK